MADKKVAKKTDVKKAVSNKTGVKDAGGKLRLVGSFSGASNMCTLSGENSMVTEEIFGDDDVVIRTTTNYGAKAAKKKTEIYVKESA